MSVSLGNRLLSGRIPGIPSELCFRESSTHVGAGNGIVAGEAKGRLGGRVKHLVGTDILPDACMAAIRDRPGVYDQYLTADLTDESQLAQFGGKQFDIMITCAALGPGWGDMPLPALLGALTLVREGGLVAITVNEIWLGKEDGSSWGQFIAKLNGKNVTEWISVREL